MAPPFATVDNIAEYMDDPQIGPELRVKVVLRTAGRLVAGAAPPPDPENVDVAYREAARDCELQLFDYLWVTKGYQSSRQSIVGSSISFQKDPDLTKIIRDSMGEYVPDADQGGDTGKAYVGRLKL